MLIIEIENYTQQLAAILSYFKQEADNQKKNVEAKYKAAFNAKQKGLAYAGVSEDGEELPMPELKFGSSSIVVKKETTR